MTAPAATSDAVRTSELRRFGGGCEVGRSAAAGHARLVAAMAQTMPCCGRRMVVVVSCCQSSLARMIDLALTLGRGSAAQIGRALLCRSASRRKQLDRCTRSSASDEMLNVTAYARRYDAERERVQTQRS